MNDSLREFSDLIAELDELIAEWKKLTTSEQIHQKEQFRDRHKEIAAKIARLPKPQDKP